MALKRTIFNASAKCYESRCSKCPPSNLTHACTLFLNARTAFWMNSCGRLSQICCSTIFSSAVFGFGECLSYLSSVTPHTEKSSGLRSGEFGGHLSLLTNSGQWCSSQSCACWSVSRCTILLLKQEVVLHELTAIINQSRQQLLSVITAVHLHLLRNEVQSTLPHEADSC